MECATNGNLSSTTTAYSFGMQRESFVETAGGMGAGATMGGITYQSSGTYYYTGTGSVANVTGSAANVSYSYTTGGSMTVYAMTAASGNLTTDNTAYGTYGVYGYNGEYTHTSRGLQYLRARYLNVATGTFTSRDTYAGRMQDILSQNRYTYAENNPVGHSDPSGHAVKKSGIEIALDRLGSTLKTKINDATINIKKNMQEKVKEAGLPVVKSLNTYINEKKSEVQANIPILSVGYGKYDVVALQWPESISAKIEKAMCEAYDRCANAI